MLTFSIGDNILATEKPNDFYRPLQRLYNDIHEDNPRWQVKFDTALNEALQTRLEGQVHEDILDLIDPENKPTEENPYPLFSRDDFKALWTENVWATVTTNAPSGPSLDIYMRAIIRLKLAYQVVNASTVEDDIHVRAQTLVTAIVENAKQELRAFLDGINKPKQAAQKPAQQIKNPPPRSRRAAVVQNDPWGLGFDPLEVRYNDNTVLRDHLPPAIVNLLQPRAQAPQTWGRRLWNQVTQLYRQVTQFDWGMPEIMTEDWQALRVIPAMFRTRLPIRTFFQHLAGLCLPMMRLIFVGGIKAITQLPFVLLFRVLPATIAERLRVTRYFPMISYVATLYLAYELFLTLVFGLSSGTIASTLGYASLLMGLTLPVGLGACALLMAAGALWQLSVPVIARVFPNVLQTPIAIRQRVIENNQFHFDRIIGHRDRTYEQALTEAIYISPKKQAVLLPEDITAIREAVIRQRVFNERYAVQSGIENAFDDQPAEPLQTGTLFQRFRETRDIDAYKAALVERLTQPGANGDNPDLVAISPRACPHKPLRP